MHWQINVVRVSGINIRLPAPCKFDDLWNAPYVPGMEQIRQPLWGEKSCIEHLKPRNGARIGALHEEHGMHDVNLRECSSGSTVEQSEQSDDASCQSRFFPQFTQRRF